MASVSDMHDSSSNSNRQRELSFDSVYSDDDSQCSDSDDTAITTRDKWQTVSNEKSSAAGATATDSDDIVLDETTFSELVARFSVDVDGEVPKLNSCLADDGGTR
jgi:hypothetical protein